MRSVKSGKESTGRMKKHRYSKEFKVMTLKLANAPGIETQAVAAALSIHPFMRSRWMKEYRAGCNRPESDRSRANHGLLRQIATIHEHSHGSYGSLPVWGTLKRQGICCGENRVARLMRQAGLKARVVKVTRRAPGVHRFFEATDNARLEQGAPRSVNQSAVGGRWYSS